MNMQYSFRHVETIEYTTEQCCQCAVYFGMPKYLNEQRRKDKEMFYCPNGHPQHYMRSDADVLRDKLNEQIRIATRESERAALAEEKLKKMTGRVKHGVCPCCHRTFQQLARHMKTKHPEMLKQ
jgi:hypothetical protein